MRHISANNMKVACMMIVLLASFSDALDFKANHYFPPNAPSSDDPIFHVTSANQAAQCTVRVRSTNAWAEVRIYSDSLKTNLLSVDSQAVIAFSMNANQNRYIVVSRFDPQIGRDIQVELQTSHPIGVKSINWKPMQILTSTATNFGSRAVPRSRAVSLWARPNFLFESVQWQKKKSSDPGFLNIPGAILNPLGILSMADDDAAQYRCVITTKVPVPPPWVGLGTLQAYSDTVSLSVGNPEASINTWSQSGFMISTCHSPKLTRSANPFPDASDDAAYGRMKNSGFTIASTGIADSIWLHLEPSGNPIQDNHSPQRLLDVSARVGIKTFITDLSWFQRRFQGVFDNYSKINMPYGQNGAFKFTQLPNSTPFFGYNIDDEPHYRQFHTGGGVASEELLKLEFLAAKDPTKVGFINLRGAWGFADWNEYVEYVQKFASNTETKILSFDYYPFTMRFSDGVDHFEDGPLKNDSGHAYASVFHHHDLYAKSTQTANLSGKDLKYWGFASCSQGASDSAFATDLNEGQIRYGVSVPLIYGAKGLTWYMYSLLPSTNVLQTLKSPTDGEGNVLDAFYFNTVSTINHELLQLGSTLMKLKWIRTIHGSQKDTVLQEEGLEQITSATEYLASISNPCSISPCASWSADKLAVGIFKLGSNGALMIMNKSVTVHGKNGLEAPSHVVSIGNPNTSKYTLRGYQHPRLVSKGSSGWTRLTPTRSFQNGEWFTSFELTVQPGDFQLVSANVDLNPARSLLLF